MEKKWEEMTAAEKREARFAAWISPEGIPWKSPEAEAKYKASATRFKNAVLLEKIPDRVPIFPMSTFMPTDLYGVTPKECLYDYDKLLETHLKFIQDFDPDYYGSPAFIGSGKIYELLGLRGYKWAGYNLPDESVYQAVEDEYMRAEDYPALIDDPSDFGSGPGCRGTSAPWSP